MQNFLSKKKNNNKVLPRHPHPPQHKNMHLYTLKEKQVHADIIASCRYFKIIEKKNTLFTKENLKKKCEKNQENYIFSFLITSKNIFLI